MPGPRRAKLSLLVTAVLAITATHAYECPTTCLPTANCKCGTSGIPGGLDASVVPQFIVLTTDDAVTLKTKASLLQITDNHVNDNGCAMPATWFAPVDTTSVPLVQQLFVKGHEIATQTMSGTSVASLEEIVGAKTWYNQTAKLPMEKIQGFRAPYLAFSPEQRAILSNNGFRYDSSISESFPSTTSPSATNLLWPYTMDYGIPQVCTTGVCSSDEVYAGLWEFPVWDTQNSDASLAGTMNPQGDLYSLYKLALDNRRSGNRAPLGVYVTAAWLEAEPERLTQLNAFFDYAAALPYTWLVTVSQVLDWINDPTVATKYAPTCLSPDQLLAELPGVKICTQPNVGCSYGTWDSDQCLCICQGAESTTGGYCRDAVGSCTVAKGYDFASKEYICPIGTSPPSPPPSPPPAVASPVSGPSWGPAESIAPVPAPTQVSPSIQLSDGLCGHDLLSFAGLTISGYESLNDGYAVAIKALDGSCETCAMAPVTGTISYISIDMGYSVTLSSVSIRSSYDVLVNIYVGESAANNGMNNAQCAQSYQVRAGGASVVPCAATGTYVTVQTKGTLTLCDIYPVVASSAPPPPSPVARSPVIVDMDVTGLSTAVVTAAGAPAICGVLVSLTNDVSATCSVTSVAGVPAGRRRLLDDSSVHVTAVVQTADSTGLVASLSNTAQAAARILAAGAVPVTASSIIVSGGWCFSEEGGRGSDGGVCGRGGLSWGRLLY
ncbi:hypothetical protein ACKKBF_B01850 [Auxenochlorella protothecoides x Auxenochlorella symbiontica]